MTPLSHIFKYLILTLIMMGNPSLAQDRSTPAADPHTRTIQNCISLMKQAKWQQTLDLLNPFIEQNKHTGLKQHGAKFATTYYYKGLCLLKLAHAKNQAPKQATTLLQNAIQALDQCYAINPPNDTSNNYRIKSLLFKANALQALEKYQDAITTYNLFLQERDNTLDPYNITELHINLALCHWKKSTTPSPATAKQVTTHLQTALTHAHTDKYKPSSQSLATALAILTNLTAKPSTPPSSLEQALTLLTLIYDQYPEILNTDRAQNLYNITRLAAQTGHTNTAITRAHQFLETYPSHPLHTPTQTILLSSLYHNQQYQETLTLSQQVLTTKTPPSDTTPDTLTLLQTASFTLAASHYYLGDYITAAPLLTQYISAYPRSPYHTDASYLTAAVQHQLHHWDTSTPLLNHFITHHPSSTYTPFAYHDIAFAQYSQNKPHTAILTLLPFTLDIPFTSTHNNTNFTRSQISPSAAILLGNIHLTLGHFDNAVTHYQDAIQLATQIHNTPARDEAYYLLTNLLGKPLWDGLTNHRLSETIPYYLHFITLPQALHSSYHTQILTSSITALEKADLTHPIHTLLQQKLFTHNNTPNTPGIENALHTYLYLLRKANLTTPDILHTLTTKVKTTHSSYHQALLTTAEILTLEHQQQRTPTPATQKEINQLYQHLITQYRNQDLDNFTLLKIANHLQNTNDPIQATTYYQSIIDSTSNIKQTEAQLALAIQLAHSTTPSDKQAAQQQLKAILESPFTSPAPRATAHYHIIQLLHQATSPDWPEIQTNALTYLTYPLEIKTHNLEVQQLLALAYDKQQNTDQAIATYTHIWVTSLYSIQHSAPALHRVCQLLWSRNNPAQPDINQGKSDRQLAYETAYKYIRKTKDHIKQRRDTLTPATIQTWEDIKQNAIKTYPTDPTIKPFKGNP